MRRQGPYDAQRVPSFAVLVEASTKERADLMRPLVGRVDRAGRQYVRSLPDVHGMRSTVAGKADRNALVDGYDGRTVAIKRLLSAMVDSLPEENADLCPYCSLDQNPDLDHFLPKAKFAEFSLFARNLIPICTPCNRKKLSAVKTGNGDRMFLNPAFEPSIDQPILEASISYAAEKVFVTYAINNAGPLPAPELAVAKRHFKRLDLADRYRKRAHAFLSALKNSTKKMSPAVKAEALRNKIEGAHLGCPANSWEPALARAIEEDLPAMLAWLAEP
ncbi:MAG: HNH endonuclease signature motif containing protein [Parvibaculum sp.]|uniref:HNH endonuclease n=1 Tax=Parvibaculum sp. TaxID=2024848 RepID=UPI00271D4CC2|nr:HNH endonuclease signature motif containing protein [Parvibaculum sp.]MDO8838452.1 HNH endonuclease signature motif containing protein [Parvibaculum sp.]